MLANYSLIQGYPEACYLLQIAFQLGACDYRDSHLSFFLLYYFLSPIQCQGLKGWEKGGKGARKRNPKQQRQAIPLLTFSLFPSRNLYERKVLMACFRIKLRAKGPHTTLKISSSKGNPNRKRQQSSYAQKLLKFLRIIRTDSMATLFSILNLFGTYLFQLLSLLLQQKYPGWRDGSSRGAEITSRQPHGDSSVVGSDALFWCV